MVLRAGVETEAIRESYVNPSMLYGTNLNQIYWQHYKLEASQFA